MVGAGISCPTVPLASEIVRECKLRAQQNGTIDQPSRLIPIEEYSWWFQEAFHSPRDRQEYLRNLIKDRPISHGNLRLAHLLLDKKVSNLVVTTNFDDFLSKALTLFGATHLVCDHPAAIQKIDPENDDLQIVHVHGTYWVYNCCNLKEEIEARSKRPESSTSSMANFLDRVLSNRSPLVVGYSGWENDVFMSALNRRLVSELPFNIYWFCHRRSSIDTLPTKLKEHPNVFFVLPPPLTKMQDVFPESDQHGKPLEVFTTVGLKDELVEQPYENSISSSDVFDELIRKFELQPPLLTRDPLEFQAQHLRRSLPLEEVNNAEPDIYRIDKVIERIDQGRQKLIETSQITESPLEAMRNALRRSQYLEAIKVGNAISQDNLNVEQLHELMNAMWIAAAKVDFKFPEQINGYNLIIQVIHKLMQQGLDGIDIQL